MEPPYKMLNYISRWAVSGFDVSSSCCEGAMVLSKREREQGGEGVRARRGVAE